MAEEQEFTPLKATIEPGTYAGAQPARLSLQAGQQPFASQPPPGTPKTVGGMTTDFLSAGVRAGVETDIGKVEQATRSSYTIDSKTLEKMKKAEEDPELRRKREEYEERQRQRENERKAREAERILKEHLNIIDAMARNAQGTDTREKKNRERMIESVEASKVIAPDAGVGVAFFYLPHQLHHRRRVVAGMADRDLPVAVNNQGGHTPGHSFSIHEYSYERESLGVTEKEIRASVQRILKRDDEIRAELIAGQLPSEIQKEEYFIWQGKYLLNVGLVGAFEISSESLTTQQKRGRELWASGRQLPRYAHTYDWMDWFRRWAALPDASKPWHQDPLVTRARQDDTSPQTPSENSSGEYRGSGSERNSSPGTTSTHSEEMPWDATGEFAGAPSAPGSTADHATKKIEWQTWAILALGAWVLLGGSTQAVTVLGGGGGGGDV